MLLTIIAHRRPGESRTTKLEAPRIRLRTWFSPTCGMESCLVHADHAKKEKKGRQLSPRADLASAKAQKSRSMRKPNPESTDAECALFHTSGSPFQLLQAGPPWDFEDTQQSAGGRSRGPRVHHGNHFLYMTFVTKTSEGTAGRRTRTKPDAGAQRAQS